MHRFNQTGINIWLKMFDWLGYLKIDGDMIWTPHAGDSFAEQLWYFFAIQTSWWFWLSPSNLYFKLLKFRSNKNCLHCDFIHVISVSFQTYFWIEGFLANHITLRAVNSSRRLSAIPRDARSLHEAARMKISSDFGRSWFTPKSKRSTSKNQPKPSVLTCLI